MGTSKKVMIVEDDPLLSIVEEKLIVKLGYTVVGKSKSGEEALEKIEEYDPEILVMDVQLAGQLDGIDTVIKLRNKNIEIPVIYLSGDNHSSILKKASQTNFIDFLLKPVSIPELSSPLKKAEMQLAANTQFAA